MALIQASDLALALGITDSTDSGLLTALAAEASAVCDSFTGRELMSRTNSEYYTGNNYPSLPLRRRPVTSVAAVYYDPAFQFGNATLLTPNQDYRVDWSEDGLSVTGCLILLQYPNAISNFFPLSGIGNPNFGGLTYYGACRINWPPAENAIKVTYTGGYINAPADLKGAAINIGCWLYNSQEWGGQSVNTTYIDTSTARVAATEAVLGGTDSALGSARKTLQRYREMPFGSGP